MSSCIDLEAMEINVDGNIPITTIITIRKIARTLEDPEVVTGNLSSGAVQKVRRTMVR